MKKFKKAVSLLAAAAMTATMLSACGGSDANQGADTQEAAGAETTESAGGTETSESTGASFKIGAIGPSTGGAAVYGIAVQNGADLAVKEINAAGGINGHQIEYNFQDDECDNEKSVNAYNTLKDWGMQMLVGTTRSEEHTSELQSQR